MRTRRRIYYTDWLDRVDLLLIWAVGHRTSSFRGFDWEGHYNAGRSPGEVVDRLVEALAGEVENDDRVNV